VRIPKSSSSGLGWPQLSDNAAQSPAGSALGHLGRLALASIAFGLALSAVPLMAAAAGSPAERLAAKYSPVIAFRQQEEPCGSGEAYRPTSVDLVLGNPEVTLRDSTGTLVTKAPTASDLWALGPDYYLDLPGDPLHPGCGYEQDFRRWSAGRGPTVYAHIARDPGYPGKLAVQYWLFTRSTTSPTNTRATDGWRRSTSMRRRRGEL
jgi:hypothetical protein